jgi:type I restriction enzyme S subunit
VKDRTGGFKVLRLTALKNGKIDLQEYKEGDWEAADAANHVVRKGDFLLSRGNGSIKLVGRGGVVLENANIAFPDTMIRLPLDLEQVDPTFFVYLWNSEQVRRQIEDSARTTAGIYKINQSLLTRYRLPLCSLPEQREIVRLLDEQFTVIEQNEREIDAALKRSAALRQSILRKAFTGQLVPQDPTDEPATALLEKIRAACKSVAKKGRKGSIDRINR